MPSRFDFVPMVCIPNQFLRFPLSFRSSPLTHVANRHVEITIVVDISERRGQPTVFEKRRRPALSRNGQAHFSGAAVVQDISCWVRYVRSCPSHALVQRRGPSSHHCRNRTSAYSNRKKRKSSRPSQTGWSHPGSCRRRCCERGDSVSWKD